MRSVCLAIIVLLLLDGETHANKAKAREIFLQAEAKFKNHRYRAALALYTRAYDIAPLPGFHFNIAQCHRMLGEHEDAMRHFELYLRKSQNPQNRKLAKRLLRLSRKKLGQRTTAKTPQDQAGDVEPVPGISYETAQTSKPPKEAPVPVKRSEHKPLRPIFFWSGVAVSASLLLTGAITGALALSRSSEFRDPATAQEDLQSLKDSGEAFRTTSSVTFAIGSLFAVGAAVAYFYTDFKPRKTTVSFSPAGRGGAAVTLIGRY